MSKPVITVFGKEHCGLCEAAKKKLDLLGYAYTSRNISDMVDHHDGWRDDGSIEVASLYFILDTLPIIQLDGQVMSYPQTMKVLKGRNNGRDTRC